MTDKLTPRAKRLLIIVMVTPWLFLIVYLGTPLLNSQTRHLKGIEEHITKIAPQWKSFRADHKGFENVQLFAYTGGDGMFGASGEVPSEGHVADLRKFMEGTSPPRPVWLEGVQLSPEALKLSLEHELELLRKKSEPTGAANRSQPIGSETNRPSAAAGSGR